MYVFAVIGERLRSCNSSIIRLRNGVIPTNSFRLLVYPFIYIHCSGTQPPRTPTLPLSSTPGRAPPAACGCVQTSFSGVRVRHCLVGRPSRPKSVAAFRERPVPVPLQNLHHCLLDEPIQHRRDAKLSHPSVRLGDFHPPYRFGLVGSTQQLFPDGWPVLFQVGAELIDSQSVYARASFVALHPPQCFLQVFPLTYFLHQAIRSSWAVGSTRRHGRFSLFSSSTSGFTRQLRRKGQLHLDIPLLVVLETHGLLAAPSRSGLRSSFPAWPIHCSAFRHS